MQIKELRLQNFRNYEELELTFSPAANIIIGDNAQGKSNILEAVSYLALTFSFRDAHDREMIRWGENNFFIGGKIINNEGEKELTAAYSLEKRKLWTIDGVHKHRLNDIFGNFYTVTFSPEDLALIKRGPEQRRSFLNREMLQLFPDFCILLNKYNKVLKQRNALLKDECSAAELEPWTEQLCYFGVEIWIRRYDFIEELKQFFKDAQLVLSEDKEEAALEYDSFFTADELKEGNRELLREKFKNYLLQNAERERMKRSTIAGPQRDDLIFLLNGREAKAFASQGQQRSLVLSLKLAQLRLAEHILGETPVLLLDDVLSELDEQRAQRVLQLMSTHAQTFISGTSAFGLEEKLGQEAKWFIVKNGKAEIK